LSVKRQPVQPFPPDWKEDAMAHKLFCWLLALSFAAGAAYGSIVEGWAFKEGQTDHSGIRVEVDGILEHPPMYTDSGGHFGPWLAVSAGVHTFTYSSPGFETQYSMAYIQPLSHEILDDVTLVDRLLCEDLDWNYYPYFPPGSAIFFPDDEGRHADDFHPVEWWYANFHLTGQETGTRYGAMVAFFKEPRFRIFTISDLSAGKMYADVRGALFSTIAHDKLDLRYCHTASSPFEQVHPGDVTEQESDEFSIQQEEEQFEQVPIGSPSDPGKGTDQSGKKPRKSLPLDKDLMEAEQISVEGDSTLQALPNYICDRWYVKTEPSNDLLPFEYHLVVKGRDRGKMRLDLNMKSLKAPMLVGGDGYIEIGNGFTFYYSLTRMDVSGTIGVHGQEETVTGLGWIDHQWGSFLDDPVSWEWFSIQLDDDREIMAADVWVNGQPVGSYSDGMNLYDGQCSLDVLPDYDITPYQWWTDPVSGKTYATAWTVEEPIGEVYLDVVAEFPEHAIHLPDISPPPPTFWEGPCTVTGTIEGEPVSGRAYAELTHSY
jgi:predicted secreted hydrolase